MKKIFLNLTLIISGATLFLSCSKEKTYDCYIQSVAEDGAIAQVFDYTDEYQKVERIRLFTSDQINTLSIQTEYEGELLKSLTYLNNFNQNELYKKQALYSPSGEVNAISYSVDSDMDGLADNLVGIFLFYRNNDAWIDSIQVLNSSYNYIGSYFLQWDQGNVIKLTLNNNSFFMFEYDNQPNYMQKLQNLFLLSNFLGSQDLVKTISKNNCTKIDEYDSGGILQSSIEYQYVYDDDGKVIAKTEVGGSTETISYTCVEQPQ